MTDTNIARKRAVLVLGMHRSGTSLLAGLLHGMGVDLGEQLVRADDNNPTGYWEQADIVALQEEILVRLDRETAGPKGTLPLPDKWWERAALRPQIKRLTEIARVNLARTQGVWGFKDPRTCLMLPLWQSIFAELDVEPVYILAIRHPAAVAASMVRRNGITAQHAELSWLQHNLAALTQTRGAPQCVVDYDRWFTDFDAQAQAVIDTLAPLVGERDWQALKNTLRAQADPALRHHQADTDCVLPYTCQMYSQLQQAAQSGALPAELSTLIGRVEESLALLQPWAVAAETVSETGAPAGAKPRYHYGVDYTGLPTGTSAEPRPLKVCIASDDLVGPVRNGGIGTAYTSLGEALARAGHEVTLLYTLGGYCENRTLDHWIAHYAEQGIRFVPLPAPGALRADGPEPLLHTHDIYEWLKEETFDVVHFPEWRGRGYYCIQAKRLGLAFHDTLLVVGTHSPTAWHRDGNEEYLHRLDELEMDFMERQCVANADVVISPSAYLFDWMRAQGWKLCPQSYVQQNILIPEARCDVDRSAPVPVEELVFFGRLERRKGLVVFCDALDKLTETVPAGLRITFLGKSGNLDGEPGEKYINERAKRWPWPVRVITGKDHAGAQHYLSQQGRVAVMPSLVENSPYTVLECLGAGIPFLASRVGGIPELIHADDVDAVCFMLHARELARRIDGILRDGARRARPSQDFDAGEQHWRDWHATLTAPAARAPVPNIELANPPKVSVCMAHFNRPEMLRQALGSLVDQDYPNFEVVLVDDGSTRPEALECLDALEPQFAERGWRIVRQENRYLGAARNNAAKHATGQYLLFMDDDNIAKPHEISTYVHAAVHSGADILTSVMDVFEGDQPPGQGGELNHRALWLGASPAVGMLKNCYGDANALVRRKAFFEIGGFTEDYGIGHEDWEFFARAVLKGYALEVVPEALFFYRQAAQSMLRNTGHYRNHMRSLRPYLECLPEPLHDAIELAQGVVFSEFSALGQRNKQMTEQARAAIPAQPAPRGAPASRRGKPAASAGKVVATPAAAPVAAPTDAPAPPSDAQSAAKIYAQWLRLHTLTERDTSLCERAMQSWTQIPVLHLLVDLAQCPQGQLADTIDALGAQLLANWRLTVIADAPAPDAMFEELEQLNWVQVPAGEDRATVMTATIEAIATEWVTLIGAGDRIAPHYTFMFAEAINRHPDWRFIYCDEDSIDRAGARGDAQFKPDINPDLLRSMPYIGNGCAVRRDVLLAQGGYLCADAIAHYNSVFQVLERHGEAAIGHIADVLYHRNADNERLRNVDETRMLGQAVLTAHLQRCGIDAGVQPGQYPGSYFVDYRHAASPRVSIIIPTRDQAGLLKPCVESLLEKTAYPDFEVLIVDNQTTEKAALAFMEEVSARDPRVRVLRYPHPYNFSAINNFAAREATGDYLLLLNNDTMIVQANWLERMMAHAQRPEVGVVGARLIYANQSLQHAGIVLGMGGHGVGEHVHLQLPMSEPGHMGRAQVVQNFSVVTGACLLVSKTLYDQVGGLDEQRFGVMFNDVDLCLKLGALGRKVVWTPYATLIHHGSVSLKKAEKPESAARARREVEAMYAAWLPQLAHDPAFNEQLCLMEQRVWVPEIEIDAGIRVETDLPRIVGMGMGSEGSWHYRGVAPLTALADAAAARATLIPKFRHRIRLPSVAEIERLGTDVVLAYNTVHESYLAGLEAIRTHTDAFITFGLDDLASELPQKNPFRKTVYKDIKKRIRSALQHSHRLIVTTEPLAEAHRDMIDDIVVVPNCLERARWTTLTSQRGAGRKPRVGWAGALQHQGDLEVIAEVVRETAQEIEWVFMGMCPKSLRPYITEFHEAIEYDAYPAKLATLDLDLALAPLEYHRFNECKSNLRLLEYGVLGWPVICTNIHPYQDAPVERVPNNPRAWLTAIRDRINDLDTAYAEGDRLREWVLQNWILEDHLDRWLAALTPAAGGQAFRTPAARRAGG